MRQIFLLLIVLWLLAGCSARPTPVPTLASPSRTHTRSHTATVRQSPTLSSTPSVTRKPTNTRTPTVEFIYPSGARLRNAALAVTDFSPDSYCDLETLFNCLPVDPSAPNAGLPTVTGATQQMVDMGECQLDCVRNVWHKQVQDFWTSSGWATYELVISLYKLDSQEEANSFVATLHEITLSMPSSFEYSDILTDLCRDKLPRSTWLVNWSREQERYHRLTLGSSRGQVALTVESNVTGDDGAYYACVVSSIAAFQFDKLARLGFIP